VTPCATASATSTTSGPTPSSPHPRLRPSVRVRHRPVAVGCGSESSSSGSTQTEEQPPAGTPADTGGTPETVTVSKACHAAFSKYHREAARSDTDPSYHPDSVALRVATLKACKSKAEWLEGILPYSVGGVGCIACSGREVVYASMCTDRENLPACTN
jgi:hypothetical protein